MRLPALLAFCTSLALAAPAAAGQPFEEPGAGDKRYRFAQLYVGAETELIEGGKQPLAPGVEGNLATSFAPRLVVGGTHFWGHADLFVSIPLAAVPIGQSTREASYSPGVQIGGRVYPWRLTTDELKPFFGAAWAPVSYTQAAADGGPGGTTLRFDRLALEFGAAYLFPFGLLEGGLRAVPPPSTGYAYSRTESGPLRLPLLSGWLGFKYLFDTTLGLEADEQSGAVTRRREHLERMRPLAHIGVAAGLSSSYAMTASTWNEREHRFLADRPGASLNPDLGLTMNIPAIGAIANLAWRPITQRASAFGLEQVATRNSVSAELAFRLGDFHGFAPFAGAFGSFEQLGVVETDGGQERRNVSQMKGGYGAIFGWDLLPTGAEWLVFRTNLRYTIGLGADMPGNQHVWFDHLELNLLQVVIYPARLFGRPD